MPAAPLAWCSPMTVAGGEREVVPIRVSGINLASLPSLSRNGRVICDLGVR
jgi:hypothetical protein